MTPDAIFAGITAVATAVLAIFTWRLAVVTSSLVKEGHKSAERTLDLARTQMRVELLMKNEETYGGESMRAYRHKAAGYLLHELFNDKGFAGEEVALENVVSFFDTLGMLVRRELIDASMAWSVFGYDTFGWWDAARTYILDAQAEDPAYFEEFDWLRERFFDIETTIRKRDPKTLKSSPEQVREFLRYELHG